MYIHNKHIKQTYTTTMNKRRSSQGDSSGANALASWCFRILSQAGLTPDRDPELFRILHSCLDIIEEGALGARDGPGYYCRACLGFQEVRRAVPIVFPHGKRLCPSCCRTLVDGALEGNKINIINMIDLISVK